MSVEKLDERWIQVSGCLKTTGHVIDGSVKDVFSLRAGSRGVQKHT